MVGDPVPGMGLSKIWHLGEKHPFHGCGAWHDMQYDFPVLPRLEMERMFKRMMLQKADEYSGAYRLWLISQAYLFASLARAYGKFKYPLP
jgi:hypothetical protein